MFVVVWFMIMFMCFLIKNEGITNNTRTMCISIGAILSVLYLVFGIALG